MTRQDLDALLGGEFEKLKERIEKNKKVIKMGKKEYTVQDILKQYDPFQHKVNDEMLRKNSTRETESSETYNDAISGQTKNAKTLETTEINRLQLAIQQKIVLIAASFLVGEKILIDSNAESASEKTLLKLINKVWLDCKLDYKSKELAKLQKSETHCAELWFDYTDSNYWKGTENKGSTRRPGMLILAESLGDKLYPVKDQYGDLIAFGRGYTVNEGDEEIEHFDLYTDSYFIYSEKGKDGWVPDRKPNKDGFIPVIYHEQALPDWAPVQPLIERKEEFISNFADSNDEFALPKIVAEGEVENLPGDATAYKIDPGGSLKYLTKDDAPESMRLELEILDKEIHSNTHTPDISFETMKTLMGNGITGIGLKLLFMDPQMKASDGQEKFGEKIQRRLNLMKKMLIAFNPVKFNDAASLTISPRFRPFMPVNEVEFNELLITAYQAQMISQKTMLELSTLVKDAEKELTEIKANPPQPAPKPAA